LKRTVFGELGKVELLFPNRLKGMVTENCQTRKRCGSNNKIKETSTEISEEKYKSFFADLHRKEHH
jgi:hypothetical protein